MSHHQKVYSREVGNGNISIEGTDANGMTLTNGNTYIYSGDPPPPLPLIINDEIINEIDPNKKVQPSDPNKTASYIAVTKSGTIDVNVGNTNQQSLNVSNNPVVTTNNVPQKPVKAIIIGDSLTPSIQANSKKLQKVTAEGVLWKVGITLVTLIKYVRNYSIDDSVTHVFISIGTNDTYLEFKNATISDFISSLKEKFPNAKVFIISGLYGYAGITDNGKDYYGNKIDKILPRIEEYYQKWVNAGAFLLKNSVGSVTSHPGSGTPSIKKIGAEIDEIIGSVTPLSPPPPSNLPKRERTKITGSVQIETGEEDLYNDEFINLPEEEAPVQLYDVVYPTDPSVTTTNYNDPKIYSQYFATKIAGGVIRRTPQNPGSDGNGNNPPSTPAGNYKLDGKRIDPTQCSVYFGSKCPYIAQYNGWGCFVTSLTMVAQEAGVGITQEMFYEAPNYTRKAQYILPGNACNFSKLQEDYPRLKRETNSTTGDRKTIFDAYVSRIKSLQKPIVIRIRGTSNAARGHYVVAVGLTTDNNIIIHNPGSQKIAFEDQVIGSNMCLGTDQKSDNGKNYDIIYID